MDVDNYYFHTTFFIDLSIPQYDSNTQNRGYMSKKSAIHYPIDLKNIPLTTIEEKLAKAIDELICSSGDTIADIQAFNCEYPIHSDGSVEMKIIFSKKQESYFD